MPGQPMRRLWTLWCSVPRSDRQLAATGSRAGQRRPWRTGGGGACHQRWLPGPAVANWFRERCEKTRQTKDIGTLLPGLAGTIGRTLDALTASLADPGQGRRTDGTVVRLALTSIWRDVPGFARQRIGRSLLAGTGADLSAHGIARRNPRRPLSSPQFPASNMRMRRSSRRSGRPSFRTSP